MNRFGSHLLTTSNTFLGTFGPALILRAASFPKISLHHLHHSSPRSSNLKAMTNLPTQILTQQQAPQGHLGLPSGGHQNIAVPQPVPINIAHALPLMPARVHSSAPKFNSSFPRELRWFFQDLENWFDTAQVTDSALCKEHAVRYVELDTSNFWKTIPEWSTGMYQSWKDALLRVYPGNQVAELWSISDLDKLKGETLCVSIRSLNDFTQYFTTFYTILNYLITQNHYSEMEQSRDFPRGMQQELWLPILDLLCHDNRAQHHNLPFSLRQMFDAGNKILLRHDSGNPRV
jgi:hypothetical protein